MLQGQQGQRALEMLWAGTGCTLLLALIQKWALGRRGLLASEDHYPDIFGGKVIFLNLRPKSCSCGPLLPQPGCVPLVGKAATQV